MKKFRFGRSEAGKLSRAISRFNKTVYGLDVYVTPLDYKEIKSRIRNKKDFNRELNKINRIHKPGALDIVINKAGFKMLRYEVKELQYQVNAINNMRRAIRQRYGIPENKIMFKEEYNMLTPKRNFTDSIRNRWEFEKWKDTIHRQSSPYYYDDLFDAYKENLLKALRDNWPQSETRDELENLFKVADAKTLWSSGIDTVITDIQFIYDAIKSDASIMVSMERALQEWKHKLGIPYKDMEASLNDEDL